VLTILCILLILVVALGTLGIATLLIAKSRITALASARLGRPVRASHVTLATNQVTITGLEVGPPPTTQQPHGVAPLPPLVHVPHVVVRFPSLWVLLRGGTPSEILLDGARVTLRRTTDGHDNFSDILARLRSKHTREPQSPEPTDKTHRPMIEVRHASLEMGDELHGVTLHASSLEAVLPPSGPPFAEVKGITLKGAGPTVAVARVLATFSGGTGSGGTETTFPTLEIEGGKVAPLQSLALTGIRGSVRQGDTPGKLDVDLRGGYGGVPGELWTASGEIYPKEQRGKLNVTAARFTLDKLKPVLDGTPLLDPAMTSVDASLRLTLSAERLEFDGGLSVSGLSLFHPRLGPQPVSNIEGLAHVHGAYVHRERRITLDEAVISFRGIRFLVSGDAAHIGQPDARYEVRLRVPPVACDALLAALPDELVPLMKGFRLRGTFKADLRTLIDMGDLDKTELGGRVGIDGCEVVAAPPEVLKIEEDFTHRVKVGGREVSFWVGKDNPAFVPFADISPAVFGALTTTEDGAFFTHHGFIPSTFRTALVRNLKKGAFSLGASTITMQMVKNALLTPEKTLSRKLQELFLTWFVETWLTKERIMELYLNIIEFGPFLYGIGPAAKRYFGKRTSELTPLEAAFFASILPNPKKRYVHYCRGHLSPVWDKYVRRILLRMYERGRITRAEYDNYKNAPLVLSREEFPGEKECFAQIAAAQSAEGVKWVPGVDDEDTPDPELDDEGDVPTTPHKRRIRRVRPQPLPAANAPKGPPEAHTPARRKAGKKPPTLAPRRAE